MLRARQERARQAASATRRGPGKKGEAPPPGPSVIRRQGTKRTRGRARPEVGSPTQRARHLVTVERSNPSFHLKRCTLIQGQDAASAARTSAASGQRDPQRTRQEGRSPSAGPVGDPTPRHETNPRTRSTRSRITDSKGPALSDRGAFEPELPPQALHPHPGPGCCERGKNERGKRPARPAEDPARRAKPLRRARR